MNAADFDTLLATPSVAPAISPHTQILSYCNLTSYSAQELFHTCPRKFALKKFQAAGSAPRERANNVTFAFGHAVGAGVAAFDASQNINDAIWAAFIAWDVDLLDVEVKKIGKGKGFAEAIWALQLYEQFYNESDYLSLRDYELVKMEATLAIDFENGHYYCGHIDELLRHKETGAFLVKENKTTGLTNIDAALYSNSDQALSYAVVVDMLGGANFDVLYTVYSSAAQQWRSFSFVKQGFKKAEWLQDQLLMHRQIDSYTELNFFPKRGRSCMSFMRRCEYYEDCDIDLAARFPAKFAELPRITELADIAKIEHIDFSTTLSQIIKRQKERMQS